MSKRMKIALAAAVLCMGGAWQVPQEAAAAQAKTDCIWQEPSSAEELQRTQEPSSAEELRRTQEPSSAEELRRTQEPPAAEELQRTQEPSTAEELQGTQEPSAAEVLQREQLQSESGSGKQMQARQPDEVSSDSDQVSDTAEIAVRAKAKSNEILPAPAAMETASVGYDSVTLSWSAVTGAAGYQVEYSVNGTSYTVAGKTKSNVRTYKCKKLLTGTEYQFRVCALDAKGKAGNYVLLKAQPYLKRTKFTETETIEMQAVSLAWNKVSGASAYQLYRRTAADQSYRLLATTSETFYLDEKITAGESYIYRVRAVCQVNNKTVKAKLSAEAKADVMMPAAELLTCTGVDYRSICLTWRQAEGVTGYYIYRSVKENGTYRKIKTITKNTALSYTDTGIVPGKKFFYKICTYQKEADETIRLGELSACMSTQTQINAPNLTAVEINSNSRGFVLRWEKVPGATGYRIYRSEYSNKGFAKVADVDGETAAYEDQTAASGTIFYYRIKSLYANRTYTGLSQPGNVLRGNPVPATPVGLTVRQTGTDILEISWEESPGAEAYNLYRAESAAAVYTCIAKGLTELRYMDTGLKDNKTYFYRLSAVSAAGEGEQCRPVRYMVGGVSLNTRTLKVCVGVSKPLELSTLRAGRVIWSSSDAKIAEVDSDGMVTGISCGTATVTATVAGKSASAVVSVTPGTRNGIDVSRWQEDVDWYRVKSSGVEFAFLRISNHYDVDETFEEKYQNASAVDMPLGVYCYSRAATVEEAEEEARTVLRILNGRKLEYPIALDMEDKVHKSADMTKETLHEMILAFKNVIESQGYHFVLYSYLSFLDSYLDKTKLDGIDLWIARYRKLESGHGYTGTGNVKYWQYNDGQFSGSNSQVDGITDAAGNLVSVDVNIEY